MLRHVLVQIKCLSVRLSAVRTYVNFEMFRVLVLWYVIQKCRLVGEAFVAAVALKRLIRLMTSRVGLQIGQLTEGFVAAAKFALVRLFSRMCPDVLLEMRKLRKLFAAELARTKRL
jgi:hypothetical protein